MSIKNKKHYQEFEYDFDVHGGAIGDIVLGTLPADALVRSVYVKTLTGVASAGAATVSAGHSDSNVAYLAAQAKTVLDAAGKVAGGQGLSSVVNANSANKQNFVMAIAAAALTAGKLLFVCEYFQPSE